MGLTVKYENLLDSQSPKMQEHITFHLLSKSICTFIFFSKIFHFSMWSSFSAFAVRRSTHNHSFWRFCTVLLAQLVESTYNAGGPSAWFLGGEDLLKKDSYLTSILAWEFHGLCLVLQIESRMSRWSCPLFN